MVLRAINLLKTTAEILDRLATVLENGSQLSDKIGSYYAKISLVFGNAYSRLSPEAQSSVLLVSIFVGLLSFAFTMPHVVRFVLGSDPPLDTVPLPSAAFDPDLDEQGDSFVDEDVKPQLSAEATYETMPCVAPHTGESLGHVVQDTLVSVKAKAGAARKAQVDWARTSFAERRRVLRVLRDYFLQHQTDLCGLSRTDTGKTMLDASLGEILTTLEKIRWLLKEGESVLKPSRRSVGPLSAHKVAEVVYEPLGVIAAIAPWNYPIHNFLNPVLAALFSGNAAIVKPSEYTVYSSLHIARLTRRALAVCGHSPELVQLVVGGSDVGKAIVNADVDKLFFTGSTKVGRHVAVAAAERLLPVVLELGGKDPFIVCASASIPHAVSLCMRGVFQNAGQNCIGVERVFVHKDVKEAFLESALSVIRQLRLGVDVGAMTMGEPAIKSVLELISEAQKAGAKLLHGGKRGSVNGKGSYLEPTLLDGVTADMRIAKEEVFAPVMSVFCWETQDELLDMVNKCSFGLGSSVFSGNKIEARRIVEGMRVGMANINDFGINYLCQSMPFGGTKQSGSDRFAGVEGLRGCCLAKSTTRDRFPLIKTVLPKNFKYPVSGNSFSLASEINQAVYRSGTIQKIDASRNILVSLATSEWMPRETKADMDRYL